MFAFFGLPFADPESLCQGLRSAFNAFTAAATDGGDQTKGSVGRQHHLVGGAGTGPLLPCNKKMVPFSERSGKRKGFFQVIIA